MKKKGLIISTVVMVVVLIASLTTATYAWFSSSQSVVVDTIKLSVESSARVKVGVLKDTTSAANDINNYFYETVESTGTENAVAWANGTKGLGGTLKFNDLKLGGSKAIGTGTPNGSSFDVDVATFDYDAFKANTKKMVKAEGKNGAIIAGTPEIATANVDYLHATIGASANKENVKGLYVKVEVTTDDTLLNLGVNSAVHFMIVIGDKMVDVQPFGDTYTVGSETKNDSRTTNKDELYTTTTRDHCIISQAKDSTGTVIANQVTSTFYFWIAQAETGVLNRTDIHNFTILAFIEGADVDCVDEGLGAACKIDITFDGTDDITKLGDGTAIDNNTMKFLTFA